MVEPLHQVGQPDGIDVEDRRGVWVGPLHRRVSAHQQQVPDPARRGPQQVREHPHHVAVAAGVVDDGLDAGLPEHDHPHRDRGHAGPASRVVHDADRVGTRGACHAGALQHLRQVPSARGEQLDAGDESARGELLPQRRARLQGGRRFLADARRPLGGGAHHIGRVAGLQARYRGGELPDVLRRRPTAAAHEAHAGLDHAARVAGHVLGARHVDLPVANRAREPRVGLRGEGEVGDFRHPLQRFQHGGGAHRAVEPDHVRPQRFQLPGQRVRGRAVHRLPVLPHRHLRDDREIGARAHRPQRRRQLGRVREGLQHEAVHASSEQPFHLRTEVGFGVVGGGVPPGLHADAQRADGSQHQRALPHSLPRQGCCAEVELEGALLQAVGGELHGVGAEGVGLHQLRARAHVLLVDLPHHFRLLHHQRVVADVDEDAAAVEERAHGAVQDVHAAVLDHLPE